MLKKKNLEILEPGIMTLLELCSFSFGQGNEGNVTNVKTQNLIFSCRLLSAV